MIIGVEGLSKSGKTTFINKWLEKYPDTLRFRGAGAVNIGIQGRWQEYNFWMHNIIEQFDKLNNHEPIILWDRFITDAVHTEDSLYSSEIFRAMKSHKKKFIIYIDVPSEWLLHRGSKEGGIDIMEKRREKYLKKVSCFDHVILTPTKETECYITDQHVEGVYSHIMSRNNSSKNITNDPY